MEGVDVSIHMSSGVTGVATDFRVGGGAETQEVKPRVTPNPVFSPDFGHLFFIAALSPDTMNFFELKKVGHSIHVFT